MITRSERIALSSLASVFYSTSKLTISAAHNGSARPLSLEVSILHIIIDHMEYEERLGFFHVD